MGHDVSTVTLSVPADAAYARSVRMMAANLAVVCNMSVDAVEDVRMAAGEGFVYACATDPVACSITFAIGVDALTMEFALGKTPPDETRSPADLELIELMLDAVCDEVAFDGVDAVLRLVKRTEVTHAE